MDWQERNTLAEQALLQARFTTRTGFARSNCPFCASRLGKDDKKACLAISTTTGWFRCWKCGTKGKIGSIDAERAGTATQPRSPGAVSPPTGFMELAKEPARSATSTKPARSYMSRRGVCSQTIEEAQIGCCITGKWANRVVVPVITPGDEWIGWVSRLWSSKAKDAYRTAPGMVVGGFVFNHSALVEETETPLMVVEGCFDALPYWPDAVALLGKPKQEQLTSIAAASRPVVVVLDGDSWEEGEMLALRLQLDGARAGWVRLPPKEDPNSVDPAWLWEEVQRVI